MITSFNGAAQLFPSCGHQTCADPNLHLDDIRFFDSRTGEPVLCQLCQHPMLRVSTVTGQYHGLVDGREQESDWMSTYVKSCQRTGLTLWPVEQFKELMEKRPGTGGVSCTGISPSRV